jgi:hypothetical protein
MSEVHVDRAAAMDNKTVNFPELYEAAVRKIENEYNVPEEVKQKLHEKRAFGVKKYGERSFQGSFTNAMTTPCFDDLLEELIDSINYALHIQFRNIFSAQGGSFEDDSQKILATLIITYNQVSALKKSAK